MRPALSPLDIGPALNGADHPLALGRGPDVEHRHPREGLGGIAVEIMGRIVDDQETQRDGIVDPHRRRMGLEQRTEVIVRGVEIIWIRRGGCHESYRKLKRNSAVITEKAK